MKPTMEILADPEALARRTADLIISAANETKDRFSVALSGGSTPRRLYELLTRSPYRDALRGAGRICSGAMSASFRRAMRAAIIA